MQQNKRYMTVPELAYDLSMPESWVYSQCRLYQVSRGREGIPCKKFGRAVRIERKSVEKWADER